MSKDWNGLPDRTATTTRAGDEREAFEAWFKTAMIWNSAITWRAWKAACAWKRTTARPTDDALWDQTLQERDNYHEWADKLANAIGFHLGIDVGEHSNLNCPWNEDLDAIMAAPIVGELNEDQWIDLAQRHANADWNSEKSDGYLNAVRALCDDYRALCSAALATAPEQAAPIATATPSDEARDAARYRWLVKNCFDWAAPGDGDSFDHIELHFEHELLNRDDDSVGVAIDAEIYAAAPPPASTNRLTDTMLEKLYWTAMDNAADVLRYMDEARAIIAATEGK